MIKILYDCCGNNIIETLNNWEELKSALNEDPNDDEVMILLSNNKWACLKKNRIIGYLDI